jgi:hypothetical protein
LKKHIGNVVKRWEVLKGNFIFGGNIPRMGRLPTKYKDELVRQAYLLSLLGCTEKEMAEVFGVGEQTLDFWKRTREEFLEALEKGKIGADTQVAESLFKCAVGYEYEEEVVHVVRGEIFVTKIKKYKGPDAWAANKWLSLRQRGRWSEAQIPPQLNQQININNFNFDGVSEEELRLIESIWEKQPKEIPGAAMQDGRGD